LHRLAGHFRNPGDNLSPAESFDLTGSNDLLILRSMLFRSEARSMQTYTANEAKTRFGEFLDRVQREPVRVMRHDRVVGVMVSAEDYEAMRAFYADRLLKTMDETADAAARAGLTPEKLDELLANES
jgi:prevent-host-death family protein